MKRRVLSVEVKPSTMMAILDFLELNNIETKSMAGAISAFITFHCELHRKAGNLPIYDSEEDCELLLADKIALAGKLTISRQVKQLTAQPTIMGIASRGLESLRGAIHRDALTDTDFAPPMSFNSNSEFNLEGTTTGRYNPEKSNMEDVERILEKAKDLTTEDIYPSQSKGLSMNDLDDILHREIAEQQKQDEEDLLAKITLGPVLTVPKALPFAQKKQQMVEKNDPRLSKDKFWNQFCLENDEVRQTAIRIVYFHLPHEHWSSEKANQLLNGILHSIGGN